MILLRYWRHNCSNTQLKMLGLADQQHWHEGVTHVRRLTWLNCWEPRCEERLICCQRMSAHRSQLLLGVSKHCTGRTGPRNRSIRYKKGSSWRVVVVRRYKRRPKRKIRQTHRHRWLHRRHQSPLALNTSYQGCQITLRPNESLQSQSRQKRPKKCCIFLLGRLLRHLTTNTRQLDPFL